MDEMPHVFVFTIDAGVQVWAENGVITENKETGFAFDILWNESLVAEYQRINTATATVVY